MSQNKLPIILVLVFAMAVPFHAIASDIGREGHGATLEEARADARDSLSRYINGEFVTAGTTAGTRETYTEGAGGTSATEESTFTTESSSVSVGYLRAVEYTDEGREGEGYRTSAVIRDSEANRRLFVAEMNDLKISAGRIYGSLKGKDDQAKKGILISLYGTLSEYENYRRMVTYMGHGELVPELGIAMTATSVMSEYQNIVLAEGYRLEELEEKLGEDASERERLKEQLNENRKEQRRLEKEKAKEIEAREAAARKLLLSRLEQVRSLAETSGMEYSVTSEFAGRVENAKRLRNAFLDACVECNGIIEEEFGEIDRGLQAEAKAVEGRPYRLAEKNIDGTPLKSVREMRDGEIDYLYMASLMHKAEVLKTIRENLFGSIENRYREYEEAVGRLDSTFEMAIDANTIRVSYDPVNFRWNVKAGLPEELSAATELGFDLTYGDLTGKKVQEAKYRGQQGYDEYQQFLDEVDYLDGVMRDFGKYFRVTISFSANVEKDSGSKVGFTHIGYSGLKAKVTSDVALGGGSFSIEKGADISSFNSSDIFTAEMPKYMKVLDKRGF